MSTKKRRKAGSDAAGEEEQYRPKAGPGQVIRREMIEQVGAGQARVKRFRNIGASPLLLAYYGGKLAGPGEETGRAGAGVITADDRKNCGEKFEKWWYERMGASHRDSTQPSISGGGHRSITETQHQAGETIALLRERMASRNYLIVEAFVGLGHTMVDALRYAGVEAHPVGTAFRVREAMDDLVCAVIGRQLIPMLVPGAVRKGA